MNDEMTELSVATPRHSVLYVKLMLATLLIAIIALWDGDSALHWLFVVSITSMLIYVLVVPDETYRVWVDDKRVRLVKVTTRQEHFVLPEDIVSIKIAKRLDHKLESECRPVSPS